ncbi:hypothetical protein SLEP1_g30156 [Rubroshorea leprosula]|uniref:Protein kinase domain-containing protein n=1 Tax=Rubroshorea leprosula TaxID=152421 RepID=A0AAV5K736_9ROSI|nr:hypothetical protein SLEP1_g30156 [Rubroshorea leprosula]
MRFLDSIKPDNLIGKGGSGNVKSVMLSNGLELAVKHIWNTDSGGRKKPRITTPVIGKRVGKSKEFDAEVQTLCSIRHVNVEKLLHGCKKLELDWETRHEIGLGAAKGLEYLHHGCERSVIHRMSSPANSSKDSAHVTAGTHGYIAPEYGYACKVNEKSDVYTFGVTRESTLSIADPKIPSAYKDDAIKVLRIAILCTARLPELRSTMRSLVQMLEDAEPCKVVGIVIGKDSDTKRKEATDSWNFSPEP